MKASTLIGLFFIILVLVLVMLFAYAALENPSLELIDFIFRFGIWIVVLLCVLGIVITIALYCIERRDYGYPAFYD